MRAIITALLDPIPFLVLIAAWLFVAKWRSGTVVRRTRWCVLGILLFALSALCTEWGSYCLLAPLERSYPPLREIPERAQAIIVLGGYLKPGPDSTTIGELGTDTLQRCHRAATIYRSGRKLPILVSGGAMHPDEPTHTLAEAMRRMLVDFGVDPVDIVLEDRSRNTLENARFSALILDERGISSAVMITDAAHLCRSMWSFQRAAPKVEFIACGVDFKTVDFKPRENPEGPLGFWSGLMPSTNGAQGTCTALHEWVGLAWYAASSR